MNFISGDDRNQITLMPDSVEDYVDDNNSVRVIEAYVNSLNLMDLGFSKPRPNDTGRPMYDPKDLLKLYVYGYMNKIRSSRRLETETKRNLEVIWLLRRLSPDHKTIARFRHDNSVALKNVFCAFVKHCLQLNLYGKELVAIDGSKFKAVNSADRNFTGQKIKDRTARINAKIEEYLRELEERDCKENAAYGEKSAEEIMRIITELSERKELYQSYAEELAQTGETQKSLTDPDSRRMMANGKSEVCYNVQSSVDSKNKMVVTFDVGNNVQDFNQLSPMAAKSAEIFGTKKLSAVADKGYDSASDIAACIMQGIKPHVADTDYDICLPTETQIPEGLSCKEITKEEITMHNNGRCIYLPDRNVAICPMGEILYPSGYKKNHSAGLFRNGRACSSCQCKCTKEPYKQFEIRMPKANFSKIYEDKDLYVKQISIKANKKIVIQRKSVVEHPFGTIKRAMDAGYCLTKGVENVSGEFSLVFLAYNLKRAINILGAKKLIECIRVW